MDNMKLWQSVCVTDPAAVKPITGKQYKGNSPKPYWIIQRATETFGPCGIGWGIEIVSERFERFGDESLHVACVRVWFVLGGQRGAIEQMGQTRAAYTSAAGKYIVDEDAPKKSVTDGMVKCLSMLGFAGDIFSGQWDDSKYVAWAAQETARRETPTITDEQAAELKRLLQDTGSDTAAFLAWVGKAVGAPVDSVDDMPASSYAPARKSLQAKAKKAEGAPA
jgi:hypothetical protein